MTRLTYLFCILMCSALATLHAQQNWQFHDGSVERTGYVMTSMTPPFMFDRRIEIGEDIGDYTITDGILYFVFTRTGENGVGALDLNTDQILWTRVLPVTRGSIGTTPVASGDIVYVGAQGGIGLYALDKMTGDSLWLYPTGSLYGRNPAIYGDRLFLQPGEGLVCLDKVTGMKLWTFGASAGQTTPTLDEDHVYFNTRLNDTIYALTHEGEVVWKYRSPFEIEDFESMLSKGDTFFIKTRGHIAALNRKTGEEFWNTVLPSNNSLIAGNNALTWTPNHLINLEWIGDWRDTFKLQGYDLKSGQLEWSHTLEQGANNIPTAFGDFLVQNNKSVLEFRSSLNGELVHSIPGYNLTQYFRVKVLDGQIFARSFQSVLVFKPMPTGLDEQSELPFEWSLHGNPVTDQLRVSVRSREHSRLHYRVIPIYGNNIALAGKLIGTSETLLSLDLSGLTSGMYIMQLCQGMDCDQKQFTVFR